jgi:hypothetical protein
MFRMLRPRAAECRKFFTPYSEVNSLISILMAEAQAISRGQFNLLVYPVVLG